MDELAQGWRTRVLVRLRLEGEGSGSEWGGGLRGRER